MTNVDSSPYNSFGLFRNELKILSERRFGGIRLPLVNFGLKENKRCTQEPKNSIESCLDDKVLAYEFVKQKYILLIHFKITNKIRFVRLHLKLNSDIKYYPLLVAARRRLNVCFFNITRPPYSDRFLFFWRYVHATVDGFNSKTKNKNSIYLKKFW